VVAGHETMNHYQPVIEQVNVMNLIAAEHNVWSYVRPGCIIYQWDQKSRTIINKLDCSKLVPCSESLKSIAIEEHLSPTNCQVSIYGSGVRCVLIKRFQGYEFGRFE
jgi:hypothetical protein